MTLPDLFDGKTFDPAQDGARLAAQHGRVSGYMANGAWRTLAEISAATGDPESSVSARLRDLRRPKFGGYTVERRRRTKAQHEYRVTV